LSRTFSSHDLAKVCLKLGWQPDRQSGSHMVFVRPGEPRPIIIPSGRKVVTPFIVANICRQLGIKKKQLAEVL